MRLEVFGFSYPCLVAGFLKTSNRFFPIPMGWQWESFAATIKHTYFYLFQKQGLVTNKEQLFYRQNEQFMPQAIRDTLPILLGVAPDDRLELDFKLRAAKRDPKITQKQLTEATQFSEQLNVRALGLLTEAQQVGILARGPAPETTAAHLDAAAVETDGAADQPAPDKPDEPFPQGQPMETA